MTALLPVEEAQARLIALHAPLDTEKSYLNEAIGRYLSEDVTAERDQPAAPLSAMDGYAIRFVDLPGPWTVGAAIRAGEAPQDRLAAQQAMRIFTGGLLPEGADTILIQEDARIDDRTLHLSGDAPAARGAFVRGAGADFTAGAMLAAAGERVTPGVMAAAIMGGAAQLAVRRRPRVAILSTGDELVAPGRPLAAGQIPDSNGAMLAAMLGCEVADVTLPLRVRDDRATLANVLSDMARRHDVIVTVGGASVGDHDHVRGAIADAGGRIDFWRIAMRPGKPLLAGTIGDTVVLGLPGNPASAFVTATLFLLPLVRHLAGAAAPWPIPLRAPLAVDLAGGDARRDYLRARLADGALTPFVGQDSGRTAPLAAANALLIRAVDAPPRRAGDLADYIAIA